MRQRRTSRTLSAVGGPRPGFQLIQPLTALARLQELLTDTGISVVREHLRVEHMKLAKYLPGLRSS